MVREMGTWGQRWLPAVLPRQPLVMRLELMDLRGPASRREWIRAFPTWFERYLFAGVAPAAS